MKKFVKSFCEDVVLGFQVVGIVLAFPFLLAILYIISRNDQDTLAANDPIHYTQFHLFTGWLMQVWRT